ncbi:hypothetical protein RN001_011898 [Aquatica leii]|uniref:Uncharacterized protein n=1 Tax=Aquatica leii TaxID=1421715 RepID=A0AAN7S7K6_9COLE|nr:hypothetical protein RN001_011898 [Aquatica leii]
MKTTALMLQVIDMHLDEYAIKANELMDELNNVDRENVSTSNFIVYQSNPYSTENNCSKKAIAIDSCSCKFLKPITFKRINLNRCPICLINTDRNYSLSGVPSLMMAVLIIELIGSQFNATVNHYILNKTDMFTVYGLYRSNIVIFIGVNVPFHGYDSTEKYYTHDMVWLVPLPKRMSSIEALVHIFKIELWIFVIITTILTIFIWWIILSVTKNRICIEDLGNIAVKIIYVTIWGSINKIPRSSTLKYIILIYIIYVVHIQTAFTSGLIKALTTPLYDRGIENLNDLDVSELPIYVKPFSINYLLTDSNSTLMTAITKKMLHINTTNNNELWKIKLFEFLWLRLIFNVVILNVSTSNFVVYQSNPYSTENNCSKKAIAIDSCSCKFLKPITFKRINLNRCPICLINTGRNYSLSGVPSLMMSVLIIELIGSQSNATVNHYILNKTDMFTVYGLYRSNIVIIIGVNVPFHGYDSTEKYYTHDMVWLVPLPKRMSSIEALVHIFKIELWIFVIITTILTIFIWWIILSVTKNRICIEDLGNIAVKIIYVTIWGSINKIPRSSTLKYIILIYIIYVVHIQTAFTSGLIKALTTPLYDRGIENLNDLDVSELPIYVKPFSINYLLTDSNSTLMTAITKKMLHINTTNNNELWKISTFRNCSGLVTEQLLRQMGNFYKKVRMIRDNSFLRKIEESFKINTGHYFLQNINNVIRTVVESGIMEKLWKDLLAQSYGHHQVDSLMKRTATWDINCPHKLDKEATDTADIILFMDSLFNGLNRNISKAPLTKPLKGGTL